MTLPPFSTPDLSDAYPEARVLEPLFRSYGGKQRFGGQIVTVKCFEDNSKVKALAGRDGGGRVMVVDGGASLRCALLGDLIASTAANNGWAGFVINGCIRDVDIIAGLSLGVMALNTHPRKTEKRDLGDIDVPVSFAGHTMVSGQYLYADNNGILLSDKKLVID